MRTTIIPTLSALALILAGIARAETVVDLRAERSTLTMPDGTIVPIWGFTLDANPPGSATIPGPTLEVSAGDTLTINLVNAIDMSSPFADDMESGPNGWTVATPIGTNPWAQVTTAAHSPVTSWFVSEPGAVRDSHLVMPTVFDLEPGSTLTFWHRMSSEAGYDGGVLEYRVGVGPWLDAGPLITQGAYNGTISTGYASPIAGRSAWSGNIPVWSMVTADLSTLAGTDLSLRWRFATDSSVSGQGWYVDDVTVGNATGSITPVSLVIPGLSQEEMVPVFEAGRVRSFTREALGNGGTATYRFENVRPGTFLYESGTDPSLQVQLGLYGAVIVRPGPPFQAYNPASTAYDSEIVMVLSEIDLDFHRAVDEDRYVPWKDPEDADPKEITSTVEHDPNYFLINGKPYADPYSPFPGGRAGETTLIRLLNAGLETHSMTLLGTTMTTIAQDGNLLAYPQGNLSAQPIHPGQTLDILIEPSVAGRYAFYDRRLNVTSGGVFPGGQLALIDVLSSSSCQISATFSADGPATYCAGETLTLDGSGSTAAGCAGVIEYQWRENGSDILGEVAPTYTVPASKPPGSYTYTLRATCSTDAACTDTSATSIKATPTADVPPAPVTGLTVKDRDIYLQIFWDDAAGASSYRIYSSDSPSGPFTLFADGITATSATVPVPEVDTYFSVVGVNVCGTEGP